MKSLLTVEQLSVCLHKSIASIRSDATRNPKSLPPLCRLPGTKRLLWRIQDVELWLAGHVIVVTPEHIPPSDTPRRGRPSKAAQQAKEKLQARYPVSGTSHLEGR